MGRCGVGKNVNLIKLLRRSFRYRSRNVLERRGASLGPVSTRVQPNVTFFLHTTHGALGATLNFSICSLILREKVFQEKLEKARFWPLDQVE